MLDPTDTVAWVDAPERIPDPAELLRRIPRCHVVDDANRGGKRPSSAAFDDDADGHPMSVRVRPILHDLGFDDASVLTGHEGFGLVAFEAGFACSLGQIVSLAPVESEPAHAVVVGEKHKRRVRRPLATSARWVIEPPG